MLFLLSIFLSAFQLVPRVLFVLPLPLLFFFCEFHFYYLIPLILMPLQRPEARPGSGKGDYITPHG